jgi:hypothetical protein|tara:strand:- start:8499 stop:8822 length:324 start_codon:yes stop_codon:yes gene_type:complete
MSNDNITIDLNDKPLLLSESGYSKFAGDMKMLLWQLIDGGVPIPINLLGTQDQIKTFTHALSREKKYLDAYMKHGLGDSRTMNSRYSLESAVKAFELETGLKWPFKN